MFKVGKWYVDCFYWAELCGILVYNIDREKLPWNGSFSVRLVYEVIKFSYIKSLWALVIEILVEGNY